MDIQDLNHEINLMGCIKYIIILFILNIYGNLYVLILFTKPTSI